jgi:2-polyprenyl-3-methyl-5-hydroxy-6-metoxy-1,4-benzoquinol methylase
LVTAQDRGWKTDGIEISPTAAAVAERRSHSTIHVGTIDTAPLPAAHYEAITSWEILEHVVDPIGFAGRVFSGLKPGGYWGLSTPNWDSPWERAAKQAMRKPPFHLTFWNAATIRRLLGTAGFQVCEVKEKPLAWTEELGSKKWAYLPVAVFRKIVLQHKANRLYALARKPL